MRPVLFRTTLYEETNKQTEKELDTRSEASFDVKH